MQKRSSPLAFVIAGVALVLLVGVNMIASNNRPKSQQEMQAEEARRQAEAAQKSGAAKSPNGGAAATGATSPNNAGGFTGKELVALGAETTSGDPKSPTTITIGWRWTPDVQGNPALIYQAVEQARRVSKAVRVRIVNLDAAPEGVNVPEGVSVGGRTIVPLGADGGLDATTTVRSIQSAISNGGIVDGPALKILPGPKPMTTP